MTNQLLKKALALAVLLLAAAPASGFVASASLSLACKHQATTICSREMPQAENIGVLEPASFSQELVSFAHELHRAKEALLSEKQGLAQPATTPSAIATAAPAPKNAIKALSHEIVRHAIFSTILVKFCLPRVPFLNPLVLTVAMTILKRHQEVSIGSHEW